MLKNCCHGSQRTHIQAEKVSFLAQESLFICLWFSTWKAAVFGILWGWMRSGSHPAGDPLYAHHELHDGDVHWSPERTRTDLSFGLRVPRSIRVDEMTGTGAAWVSFKMAAKGKLRFNPWDGMAYITGCPLFRQAILVRFPEDEHPLLKRRLHCNAKRSKRETVSVSRSHIKTGKIRSHQTQPMSLSMGVVGLSQNLEASISQ